MNLSAGDIISSILGGAGVLILAWIARKISSIAKRFDRFMAEHMWLIATTLWTRDNVMVIMARLDMPIKHDPPQDLPK